MKNITTIKFALLTIFTGLFLTTSANAGFLYTLNDSTAGNNIYGYSVNETTGALTAIPGVSPLATGGTYTDAVVFNAAGNLLFAANFNTRNITKYDFNSMTGVLSNSVVQPAGTDGATGSLSGLDYFGAAPTAAGVSVAGRVRTPNGRGLTNAFVSLTDAGGNRRSARTTAFGYFHFEDVAAGETYIVEVNSKRYRFAPQVLSINQDIADLELTGEDVFSSSRYSRRRITTTANKC